MTALKLLANENIPLASVTYLRTLGFDIKSIGLDNPSITDQQVMQIAIRENRIIVTYDSDYGELIFKLGYRPEAGVIFIRIQPNSPVDAARIVEKLIKDGGKITFKRTLTVIDTNGIRQRKY